MNSRKGETVEMKTKEIAIYGARMVAMSVYHAIKELYPDYRVVSFLVNSRRQNPDGIDGIPVIELKDFARTDLAVWIAAQDNYHGEIVEALGKKGIFEYVKIDAQAEAQLMERYYTEVMGFPFLHSLKMGDKKADLAVYVSKFHGDRPLRDMKEPASWMHSIQSGAALTDKRICELQDNEGENISGKNRNYSELTSMYWIGKHAEAEYLGLFHYRRMLELSEEDLYRLKANHIDAVLAYPAVYYPNIQTHHSYYVSESDWNAMKQALEELQPEYAAAMPELFAGKLFYNHNIFIARKEIFQNYCSWLFPILERTEELSTPKGWEREDRYIGYLGENLTRLYILYPRNDMNFVYTGRRMLV